MSSVAMLPDFTEGLQNGRPQNTSNRRDTILNLVEMLLAGEEAAKRTRRLFPCPRLPLSSLYPQTKNQLRAM
jgi:hypothetical protein